LRMKRGGGEEGWLGKEILVGGNLLRRTRCDYTSHRRCRLQVYRPTEWGEGGDTLHTGITRVDPRG